MPYYIFYSTCMLTWPGTADTGISFLHDIKRAFILFLISRRNRLWELTFMV